MQEFEELTRDKFEEFIALNNIEHKTAQCRLCFKIIKRIYRRCKLGYYFGDIKICKYKDMVVEGNHRYISYLLAGIEFGILDGTSSFCDNPKYYNDVEVDFDDDWDEYQKETKKYVTDDFLKDFERRTAK